MRRVVILGARGFIARALTEDLRSRDVPVRPVSSEDIDLTSDGASSALTALLEEEDSVVMTSTLTPDKGRNIATFMKNVKMADHVCQALAVRPCLHVVYISSDAVYATSPRPLSEDTPTTPTDLYALMHIVREQMLGHITKERSIPWSVVRPSAIYGAGDTHNSYGPNRFVRSALSAGTIRLFGEGEEQRDHVYIDDVVAVLRSVLETRHPGVLNVVSGRAVSFRDVADCVARHADTPVRIETAPRTGPVTHRPFDATRLRAAFPQLAATSIEAGIAQTVAALKSMVSSAPQSAR